MPDAPRRFSLRAGFADFEPSTRAHGAAAVPSVRFQLFLCVVFLAGLACKPPAETPTTTEGAVAGVRYLEQLTGGARPDKRVPMIVALHPMVGDPTDLLPLLRPCRRRARLILPYGHPSGGRYLWYDAVGEDVPAPLVAQEAARIAAALTSLCAVRPAVGQPIITGGWSDRRQQHVACSPPPQRGRSSAVNTPSSLRRINVFSSFERTKCSSRSPRAGITRIEPCPLLH